MKLLTHMVVGGSIAAITVLLFGYSLSCAAYVWFTAMIVNFAIDALGHQRVAGIPRRTCFAHSLVGPFILSTPFTIPVMLAAGIQGIVAVIAILLGAYSHILLDAFTEGGVYIYWPFNAKRWRLGSIPYDDPLVNTLAVLTAVLPLIFLVLSKLA